jgi:hypothetical protein
MVAVVALAYIQRLKVAEKCARLGYSVMREEGRPDICVDIRTGISYRPDKLW